MGRMSGRFVIHRVILISTIVMFAAVAAKAYDPPRGLKWKMSYQEVESILGSPKGDDALRLNKLEDPNRQNAQFFYPHRNALKGLKVARIDKVKLAEEKAEYSCAVFSDSLGLVALQYGLMIGSGSGGDEKTLYETKTNGRFWTTYQRLLELLSTKYGQPTENQITPGELGMPLPQGSDLKTVWFDSTTGDAIRLILQRRKEKLALITVDFLCIYLEYASRAWLEEYRTRAIENEDNL